MHHLTRAGCFLSVSLALCGCQLERGGLGAGESSVDGAISGMDAGTGGCFGGPMDENCNGADDDCDGTVDEALTQRCGVAVGSCTEGSATCSAGVWSDCAGGTTPSTEVCDGTNDEDCDGSTDEGCTCTAGSSRPCGEARGTCVAGMQACGPEGTWASCEGMVGPTVEMCDGMDQDCDDVTDEGLMRPCGNRMGVCTRGAQTCDAGSWGRCVGGVQPATETCDGTLDEDCDGNVDEGCDCVNGATMACGSSTGACTAGTSTCTSGAWGSCTGSVGPGTERCNAVDDDCDGPIDESAGCPCTVLTRSGRAYMFCTGAEGWTDARSNCRAQPGYDLIILNDAAEDAFFVSQAMMRGGGDWWIGLHSPMGGLTYQWVDGSGVTYMNWDTSEPDNTGIQCVKADTGSGGVWDDKGCGGGRRYVCEGPIP